MDEYRQFLDLEGLKTYDSLIKQYIETGSIADLRQILGVLEVKVDANTEAIEDLKNYVDEQYNSILSIENKSIDTLFNEEEMNNG